MNDLITSQKYLDGELNHEDMLHFETRLEMDNDLIDDLLILREVDELLRNRDLLEFEDKVIKSIHEYQKKPGILKIQLNTVHKYYIAASVALIIGFFSFIILKQQKPVNEKLYARYYTKYDPDVLKRSDTTVDSDFMFAIDAYMTSNYQESLDIFNELCNDPEKFDLAHLYSGLCYMELEQYQNAVSKFNVLNQSNSVVSIHSMWYTALSLLKLERKDDAVILLKQIQSDGGFYAGQSLELLNKLK